MSNAFLYPLYPALFVPSKLNPYKLVAVINLPVCFTVYGAIPSSPPWKGTENLSCEFVGPFTPVTSIEALNEPDHKLELGCPE